MVSILAILAISLITIDAADRSPFFWHRVLWSAFLATMVWSIGGTFIIRATDKDADTQRTAGVLPALGLIGIGYSAASFIVMLLFMLVTDASHSPSKAHLVIQVLLAGAAGALCALLSLARGSASSGLDPLPQGIPAPPALVSQIEEQEQRFRDMGTDAAPLATEFKRLREAIKYSLYHVGGIASSTDYHAFTTKVVDLCRDLSSIASVSTELISARIDAVRSLQREAKSIANALKR